MSLYSNSVPPYSIAPGESVDVLVPTDPVLATTRSAQVALVRVAGEPGTPFSVDLLFNQAPGAFDLEVQAASVADAAANYASVAGGSISATDTGAGNFAAHATFIAENARWISLYWKTAPANGGTTVRATIKR